MPKPVDPTPNTQHPTPTLWNITDRLNENFRTVQAILSRIVESAENPMAQVAAAAEIRHHIALAEKTLATAAGAKAMESFENAVLESIAEASPETRRRILKKLNCLEI